MNNPEISGELNRQFLPPQPQEEDDWDPEAELEELWDLAPEECFMDEEDGLPDSSFGE